MAKYRVLFEGEFEGEIFDTEEDAKYYANYLKSCARDGAETLHWSNPGDYDYDEDTYEAPDITVVEVDD